MTNDELEGGLLGFVLGSLVISILAASTGNLAGVIAWSPFIIALAWCYHLERKARRKEKKKE